MDMTVLHVLSFDRLSFFELMYSQFDGSECSTEIYVNF